MTVQGLRQIFKACSDDTRLRILNILSGNVLTVNEICFMLQKPQPSISKHLAQLRMLKLVVDRRVGNLVYYTLNRKNETCQGRVVAFIVSQFGSIQSFQDDKRRLCENRQ